MVELCQDVVVIVSVGLFLVEHDAIAIEYDDFQLRHELSLSCCQLVHDSFF